MSKGKHLYRKAELARAVRGVLELHLPVKFVRITADGQIEVEIGAAQAQDSAGGDLEHWLTKRAGGNNARSPEGH
jgi:hypothetical protein